MVEQPPDLYIPNPVLVLLKELLHVITFLCCLCCVLIFPFDTSYNMESKILKDSLKTSKNVSAK